MSFSFPFQQQELFQQKKRTRKLSKLMMRILHRTKEFGHLVRAEGIELKYSPSDFAIDLFSRFNLGSQRRVLKHFEDYLEILKQLKSNGVDLMDSRRLTWAFMKRLNLQPPSNAFSEIDTEDVIEIYNREYVQIFRNLQFFFKFKSSVFDLLILDWMTLFKRDSRIEEKIFFQMESSLRLSRKVKVFEGLSTNTTMRPKALKNG